MFIKNLFNTRDNFYRGQQFLLLSFMHFVVITCQALLADCLAMKWPRGESTKGLASFLHIFNKIMTKI